MPEEIWVSINFDMSCVTLLAGARTRWVKEGTASPLASWTTRLAINTHRRTSAISQGRSWTSTIEQSMLGKGHFPVACVENTFCSKQNLSYHVKKVHRNVLTENRSGGRLYIATGLATSGIDWVYIWQNSVHSQHVLPPFLNTPKLPKFVKVRYFDTAAVCRRIYESGQMM